MIHSKTIETLILRMTEILRGINKGVKFCPCPDASFFSVGWLPFLVGEEKINSFHRIVVILCSVEGHVILFFKMVEE